MHRPGAQFAIQCMLGYTVLQAINSLSSAHKTLIKRRTAAMDKWRTVMTAPVGHVIQGESYGFCHIVTNIHSISYAYDQVSTFQITPRKCHF